MNDFTLLRKISLPDERVNICEDGTCWTITGTAAPRHSIVYDGDEAYRLAGALFMASIDRYDPEFADIHAAEAVSWLKRQHVEAAHVDDFIDGCGEDLAPTIRLLCETRIA